MPDDSYNPHLTEEQRIAREKHLKDLNESVNKTQNEGLDRLNVTLKESKALEPFHPKFCPNCGHNLE